MAQKKSYSRYFIILQEDETGYSLASDKLPSGYTKLETKNDKCKISYYVQNLKKDKEPYYMVLICNKKDAKKLIKLGMLNIDDYGRAEITYEFAAENIAESKMSVDTVGGSAIVRIEGSDVISVMSGFASTEPPKDWRNYSLLEDKLGELRTEAQEEKGKDIEMIEVVEQREEVQEQKEEKNIFDEYEQKIEELKYEEKDRSKEVEQKTESAEEIGEEKVEQDTTEATREEEIQEDDNTVNIDSVDKEYEDIEQVDVLLNNTRHDHKDEDNHKHKDNHEHEDNHKYEDKNCNKCQCDDDKEYPTGTVGEFFRLVAEDFDEMKGICTEIKKCKWYKVPAKNLDDMCNTSNYNKYTIVYYPMISYYPYIKKNEHYMLGYKYDSKGKMKYLVYGIPGTKKRCDQPYGGKSGFVTWVPVKEGDEKEDSNGYWLMFYDFRTSTIVIPVK